MMQRIHDLIGGNPSDSVAVIADDGRSYTYGDLDRISDEMAQMLRVHGVRGGDRVVLLAENGMTYVAAILAISKVDAWIVPLNARVTERDIDTALAHSDARCILYTVDDSSAAQAHATRVGGVELGTLDCGRIVASPARDVAVEPVVTGADQVAALFYTSGTTGAPKGVMLTHANLIFVATATSRIREMGDNDVVLGVLPGTHVYGFGAILLPVWDIGATIRLMPRFDARRVLDALQDNVTLFPAVPQMYAAILKELHDTGVDHVETPLRVMSSGGAPLDPHWKSEIERKFGVHMDNGYGMTEASPTISVTRRDDLRQDTSVGLALPGLEVVLRGITEDGAGEICVRGPNVMKGYYKDTDATAKAITADGFLKTGDVGRIDPDGAIHIVGRCKELIVHSGFNVYPAEVESALNAHKSVVQSAVVGRERAGNEDVLAFVTVSGDVTEAELRSWMRENVVSYKIPLHIVLVDSLPQAATGKILKGSLTTIFAEMLSQMDTEKDA
ncbi:class I adenylate-forming enzyme family protein [Yoonia maritima]|uniref:class I adenylate-forming enzyme family protein n=1 Tax=Yoonia maritima TaxID=1435347 RepID=UPI0013A5FFAF|nr:AMP-binding protein [Yoonia maritima]